MNHTLIALAGLAETALQMAMAIEGAGIFVVGFVALLALSTRSRTLTILAFVVLVSFSVFFQPWYNFAPFDPEVYGSDVVYFADAYRVLGVGWILTSLLVVASVAVAWGKPVKPSPTETESGG